MAAKTSLLATYYRLTKPGIVYGNGLSAAAGFLLASGRAGHFDPALFVALLVGTGLVIASGCVFNNYADRSIDRKMSRTKHRALVTGTVSTKAALLYAVALGVAGFMLLAVFTNTLTVLWGVVGMFSYVVLYGITKRRGPYGTLVGSISGATPIAAGYSAVVGHVDTGTVLLFLIMALWQMPHFYAIALFRQKEYARAGLPVLPVARGAAVTKQYIIAFIVLFTVAAAALTVLDVTGLTYLVVMVALGLGWLWRGLKGFFTENDAKWGGSMFGFSLQVLLIFCVLISLDAFLP